MFLAKGMVKNMIATVLSAILYVSLFLVIFLIVFTAARCESKKRFPFIAVMILDVLLLTYLPVLSYGLPKLAGLY